MNPQDATAFDCSDPPLTWRDRIEQRREELRQWESTWECSKSVVGHLGHWLEKQRQ